MGRKRIIFGFMPERKKYKVIPADVFGRLVGFLFFWKWKEEGKLPSVGKLREELKELGVAPNVQGVVNVADEVESLKQKAQRQKEEEARKNRMDGFRSNIKSEVEAEKKRRAEVLAKSLAEQKALRGDDSLLGSPKGKISGRTSHSNSRGISDDDTPWNG